MEGLIHQRKVEQIKNFLGIDPGLKGGLVLISEEGKIVDFMPTPLRKDGLIDHDAIYKFIAPIANLHVYLERAVAFGMGRTSAFNYGRGFAAIEIAIELTGNRINYVYPQVWTRLLHQGEVKCGEPKAVSLKVARRLFNIRKFPVSRRGKVHDGLIDALLIAEYGRRTFKLN
jgi:hypothetical protein